MQREWMLAIVGPLFCKNKRNSVKTKEIILVYKFKNNEFQTPYMHFV